MNKTIYSILVSSVCCLSTAAFSTNGYSSSQTPAQAPNGGYSSSQNSTVTYNNAPVQKPAPKHGYSSTQTPPHKRPHHRPRHNEQFSFYVNMPEFTGGMIVGPNDAYFVAGEARPAGLYWLNRAFGNSIPSNTVIGGGENGHPLFVCHANYSGGVHPGKVVGGRCNISYAGKEIAAKHYQVLLSDGPLDWLPAQFGAIPPNAISGGYENGHPLFICQAEYANGMHPGKLVGRACNIAYAGREISVPYYHVLVA